MKKNILRGDIFYADLSPVIGSEQGGIRPVLVVQNNIGNKYSPTVIVAAISTKTTEKAVLPTHCYIDIVNGLDKPSIILLEQLRTIDKSRLKEYKGHLDKDLMIKVDESLAISIELNP